jgi:uncharacterized protein
MKEELYWKIIKALEVSRSIGDETGWTSRIFKKEESTLQTFIKTHSYGEYIFDWGWAEAYQRYKVPYYPKLTSMIPFTPVTTPHLFGNQNALEDYEKFYTDGPFSGSHFLFLPSNEINLFKDREYNIRESIQYHVFNDGYKNFEDFLSSLKTKKSKNLKHERVFKDLITSQYTGETLTTIHAERMYDFYISTIENKQSYDYLNKKFFQEIFQTMKENILYVEATKDGDPIAGTMFFYDDKRIYGRYWGSKDYVPNLHFELCYYQGIDFCLAHGLEIFEAGAQGEHKIARGFRPVKVFSAHKIKHEGFREAISNFIETEKQHVERNIQELSTYLPFK